MSPIPDRSTRRGNVVIIVALAMVSLLGFAALVVDAGALFQVESQLQAATEAAALAGSSHLDGTEEGLDRAEEAALAIGTENRVTGEPMPAEDLLLEFGVWDGGFVPSSDAEAIDALRVVAAARSVHTPFAGAAWSLGLHDVSAAALGWRPPSTPVDAVECFLPVMVPTCRIDAIEAAGHPWTEAFQLAPDSSDTIAWAHPDGASASTIREALQGVADGSCPVDVGVEDEVGMVNGVEASALMTLEDLLRTSEDPWDGSLWGDKPAQDPDSAFTADEYADAGVLQGAVMLFDLDSGTCAAVKFNRTVVMSDFVWGVVYDVYRGPGEHKGAQVYIDFEHDFETPGDPGGSGPGNVLARPAGRLVE